MANAIGEAFITLRPDLSKFSGEAGAAMQSSLTKMGGALTSVGRGLTVGLTAPIVAGFAIASKSAIDFETAYVSMTNKLEGTPEQFQAIADGARQMSKEMPISAAAVLDIARNAGQLGIATEDVLGFSKTVAQMAQISDMSAEAIASGMAKIANVMGDKGAESFNKMGNTIAAMGKIGASTEDQIIEMAQRIAGAASVVGMSTADVLAFANALATVGIDAEAGGTAISKLFMDMNSAALGLAPTAEELQAIADGQNAVRDSGYSLESAQRGLRDANEAVSDSHKGVRDAADGVRSANQDVSDAYADLASAQRDQTQASFDARRESLNTAQAMQNLNEVVAKGPSLALQQRDAQLAVAEATERLNDARRKGTAREVQRAELNLAQATQRLNELMVSQRGYALDVAQAQMTVIETKNREGTAYKNSAQKIQEAQKGIQDATKKRADAEDNLTAAQRRQRNSEEARLDAQRNVVRANEAYFASQRKLADIQEEVNGKLGIFAKVAGVTAEQFAAKWKTDAAGAVTDFIEGIQRLKKEGVDVDSIFKKLGLDDARMKRAILGVSGMTGAQNDLRAMIEKANTAYATGNELQKQTDALNKTTAAELEKTKNAIINAAAAFGKEFLPMLRDFLRDARPVIEDIQGMARSFSELDPSVKKAIVVFALAAAALGPLLVVIGQFMLALGALVYIAPGVAAALLGMVTPLLVITAAVLAAYLVWKHWDDIKRIVNGAVASVIGALSSVLNFLKTNWREVAVLLAGPFAPVVALAINGFGIRDALIGGFQAVLTWLGSNWKAVATAITSPFTAVVALARNAFGIRDAAISAFASAGTWLYNAGRDMINGLLNGVKSLAPAFKAFLIKMAKDALGVFGYVFELGSPSKVMHDVGQDFMRGLAGGLKDGARPIMPMLEGFAGSMTDGFAPKVGGLGMAASTGPGASSSTGVLGRAAMKSDVVINAYGPIQTGGESASVGLRTLGWGVQTELMRRGVYT